MNMHLLSTDITIPRYEVNRNLVANCYWHFKYFKILTRPLSNINEIETTNNMAHVHIMGDLPTKYDIDSNNGCWDIVFARLQRLLSLWHYNPKYKQQQYKQCKFKQVYWIAKCQIVTILTATKKYKKQQNRQQYKH